MVTGRDIDNAYALIIGISEYKDPEIPKLNYTHADAEGIFCDPVILIYRHFAYRCW